MQPKRVPVIKDDDAVVSSSSYTRNQVYEKASLSGNVNMSYEDVSGLTFMSAIRWVTC